MFAGAGKDPRDRREGLLLGLAYHQLPPPGEVGGQFATDAMTSGGIEFLTDTDAQRHRGGGVALLETFRLGGDMIADLGIEGEGVSADMDGGTART